VIGQTELAKTTQVAQILIADRNVLFLRGLKALLSNESDLRVMDEASDPDELLAKARLYAPDVLVMDMSLLGSPEDRVAPALRQMHPRMAILFVTQQDSPRHVQAVVSAGGVGYMLKSSSASQLLAGIKQVAHLSQSHDADLAGVSSTIPDLQALASSNERFQGSAALTVREEEVMRLLAQGNTVREVANELSLSIKTVEAHKLNLMRKLDIHDRASLIEYALKRGLVPSSV
jgi:two-component system, NarL family, response regulator NreC